MRVLAVGLISTLCLAGAPLAGAAVEDGSSQPDQTAAQTQVPVRAPVPPAPVPLGLDGELAPWLQVRGEFRARVEGFTGGGFATNNDDAYWMDRFRLNVTVRAAKSVTFVVQAHDVRTFEKTAGGQAAPFRDTFDLRQVYGEFSSKHTTVRIGRQDLAFGEQRLIGSLPWTNAARSFDGARVTLKHKGDLLDVFGMSVVTIRPDAFDKSGNGSELYGVYGSLVSLIPKQTLEPYVLWRQSNNVAAELGGTGPLHEATTGVRLTGKLPAAFDYSGELVVQTGSVGPDDIKAWAVHGLVGRLFANAPAQPRLFGEFNYASGDADRTDGTRGTFDQLYPTGHDKYGLADQVGWRNVEHVRAGAEIKPTSKWQMSGSYHTWWLARATDGLYSAGGALVARSVGGAAGTHVGQEVDAQAIYIYSPQLQIAGGYAYLIPGEFLRNTTPGHAYSYPYVMVTYVFLGEQPAVGGKQTR